MFRCLHLRPFKNLPCFLLHNPPSSFSIFLTFVFCFFCLCIFSFLRVLFLDLLQNPPPHTYKKETTPQQKTKKRWKEIADAPQRVRFSRTCFTWKAAGPLGRSKQKTKNASCVWGCTFEPHCRQFLRSGFGPIFFILHFGLVGFVKWLRKMGFRYAPGSI